MNTLKITALQYDIIWENPVKNFEKISHLLSLSDIEGSDIIVLPEMFNTAFSMSSALIAETMDGLSIQILKNLAQRYQCMIMGSLAITDGGDTYNRVVAVTETEDLYTYDKAFLFSPAGEDTAYTAGSQRLVIDYRGWRICPMVCYDLRFPTWSYNTSDIDLYIYMASWPETRIHHWSSLLMARAIENQAYVVGLNRIGVDGNELSYNGRSTIIGVDGTVISHLEATEQSINGTLSKGDLVEYRAKLPFLKDHRPFI